MSLTYEPASERLHKAQGPSRICNESKEEDDEEEKSTPETTQGQIDGLFSKLPFKCYLLETVSVGD